MLHTFILRDDVERCKISANALITLHFTMPARVIDWHKTSDVMCAGEARFTASHYIRLHLMYEGG